jgi:hypothetical protein
MSATPLRLTKEPVSLRAVIERLNRKLAKKQQSLHKSRRDGLYFGVDNRLNTVVQRGITREALEAMAREWGALRPWEEMTQ